MRRPPSLDPARAWQLLVASDPTLERLRLALRATLGAALAALVLPPLAAAAGAPAAVWLLGVSFAMTSALLVADRSLAGQRRSLALLPLPACAGAALAA